MSDRPYTDAEISEAREFWATGDDPTRRMPSRKDIATNQKRWLSTYDQMKAWLDSARDDALEEAALCLFGMPETGPVTEWRVRAIQALRELKNAPATPGIIESWKEIERREKGPPDGQA